MKKIFVGLSLAVLTTSAFAKMDYSFQAGASNYSISGGDSTAVGEIRAIATIPTSISNLYMAAEVGYLAGKVNETSLNSIMFQYNMGYKFSKITPYLSIGGQTKNDLYSEGAYRIGGGVKYDINSKIALNAEYMTFTSASSTVTDEPDSSTMGLYISYDIGSY